MMWNDCRKIDQLTQAVVILKVKYDV